MKKLAKILSIVMLVVLSVVMMTACGNKNGGSGIPKNAEAAAEKLEDAGYEVEVATEDDMSEYGPTGLIGAVEAANDDEMISIMYFEDKDLAEAYYETMEAMIENMPEGWQLEISGKCVYTGTEQAVADFED